MGHRIMQGSSTVTKCLQEEILDSPHKAEGFQEPDSRTWHCPPAPQVFAQECAVGSITATSFIPTRTQFFP